MSMRIRWSGLLAGAAILAGLTAGPQLAHAQSSLPTPAERCARNNTPDVTQTVTHYGNQVGVSFPNGTNPPNGVFPGDVVKVTITGAVRIDHWGNTYGPSGATGGHEQYWKSLQGVSWPFPQLNAFSSVARWNNNPGGWVGNPMRTISLDPAFGGSCTSAPNVPVRVLYYINDPGISDNGGQWTIRTDVYRATTTCAPGFFYSGIYGCLPRPW
ncbi:hypothetical protein ALI144C_31565 [Actinosynnema sp. ALI-1.44]|uniref:hypothetical protein n=1 Tax=Actinosynnema sp. ALI-1.44 TaxID=1933779 RepID=UPI00097BAEFE|nr:hypothetical protein [Actinosynnema sp. ALI-1.44]ONI77939.1 hypothetical protein ALI144C_31565 [Actinosynnema sp. ALI-1.44]